MNRWLSALKFLGMGWFVSGSILLGVLGGRWIDEQLNTEPLLLVVGLIAGLFVAFYGIYRMLPGSGNNRSQGNG
jgi:F0F1-type ATP synthase assembly protein I